MTEGKTNKEWYKLSAQIIVGAAILILSAITIHLYNAVNTVKDNQRASEANNARISGIEEKLHNFTMKVEIVDRNVGWLKNQQEQISALDRLVGVVNSTCKAEASSIKQSIRYIDEHITRIDSDVHDLGKLHQCRAEPRPRHFK